MKVQSVDRSARWNFGSRSTRVLFLYFPHRRLWLLPSVSGGGCVWDGGGHDARAGAQERTGEAAASI
jgi:hypothetical protein